MLPRVNAKVASQVGKRLKYFIYSLTIDTSFFDL